MVLFLLGLLIGFLVGAVSVAFFCMVADMSSTRPGGQVLDFTGHRYRDDPKDKIGTERGW